MSLFGICKSAYRATVPTGVRCKLYDVMPRRLQLMRSNFVTRLGRHAEHDEIYDAEYYAKSVEPEMKISADIMAEAIMESFSPGSVVDVGCGTGGLIAALSSRGVTCIGLEYAQAAIDICRQRGLQVQMFDLESSVPFMGMADVVTSTEVAEHLPAAVADRYVALLCAIAPTVVMTAAAGGGPGTDHVNEQPNAYWIEKFEARRYRYDGERTMQWRDLWRDRGASAIYHRQLMIFLRGRS